ncbi:MAG: hypothetical protein ABIJ84_01230 [bacterium]
MPVLIVYGVPSNVGRDKLESLINVLRHEVGSMPTLSPEAVSVFFPADLVEVGLGEELVCLVQGLFENPKRTTEFRRHLAEAILVFLSYFARCHLSQCKKVEVFVNRFNQDIDGFMACNPYEQEQA